MTRISKYLLTRVPGFRSKIERTFSFGFKPKLKASRLFGFKPKPKCGFGHTLVYSMKLQKCNFVCDLSWLGYQNIYSLVFGIFEPKAIRIPDALKLLLDDFGEQRSRTVVRFKHPTHVDVHVILKKNSILLLLLSRFEVRKVFTRLRKGCASSRPKVNNLVSFSSQ